MKGKNILVLFVIIAILICTVSTVVAFAEPGDATKDIINLYPHVVTAVNGLYDMNIGLYGYTLDQAGLIEPFYAHILVEGLQVTINNQVGGAQLLTDYLLTTDTERHILGIKGDIKDVNAYDQMTRKSNTNDTYYTFENAKTAQAITVEKTILIFESVQGVGVSSTQQVKGKGLIIGGKTYNITNCAGFWCTERNTIYDSYFTKSYIIYDYDGDGLYTTAYNKGRQDANNTITETSESYKKGYSKGYYEGYEKSGDIHFKDVITAVFYVPSQWLTNMLDYEVLGFNIKTFFQSIVTITIVIAIIKMII